jgi:hypothetical protein
MWKDFFFDASGVGDGIVLDDGTKVGLKFWMEDAAVLTASGGECYHVTTAPSPSFDGNNSYDCNFFFFWVDRSFVAECCPGRPADMPRCRPPLSDEDLD